MSGLTELLETAGFMSEKETQQVSLQLFALEVLPVAMEVLPVAMTDQL